MSNDYCDIKFLYYDDLGTDCVDAIGSTFGMRLTWL